MLTNKSKTVRGKVANFDKVANAAKQVKYVSDADGENVDTTAFEQASLHLKDGNSDGLDEHLGSAHGGGGSEDISGEDAEAIGTLADINEASLQELDEAS